MYKILEKEVKMRIIVCRIISKKGGKFMFKKIERLLEKSSKLGVVILAILGIVVIKMTTVLTNWVQYLQATTKPSVYLKIPVISLGVILLLLLCIMIKIALCISKGMAKKREEEHRLHEQYEKDHQLRKMWTDHLFKAIISEGEEVNEEELLRDISDMSIQQIKEATKDIYKQMDNERRNYEMDS